MITDGPTLASLRPFAVAGDWRAIIRACSGSNHGDFAHLWALAMTAHYGPVGLHKSRCREDDTPDPEKCSDVPRVFDQMSNAQSTIRRILGA